MQKITNSTVLRILKICHLLGMAMWLGGSISIFVLLLSVPNEAAVNTLTMAVIIPGAYILLLTGLIYGLFTPYGFFKQRWLTWKWVFTLIIIISAVALPSQIGLTMVQLLLIAGILFLSVFKIRSQRHK